MIIKNVINNIYKVALYIRLSKEDLDKNDSTQISESIKNQKSFLLRFVEENNYNLFDIYIDDGYSGTNFDRPAFQRMLRDIENGKVNMVITKDMSRLGRDYIGTGEFIEKYFPTHNVRYIALTDNIDTALDMADNDIAPFKAIMNDYYAKDISKKIRTSLRTKQKDGKWVGGCPPFGYKIDPQDKNHLVPNEIEAPIVKKIFELADKGLTPYAIKGQLILEHVPTSAMIRGRRGNTSSESLKGIWNTKTVKGILKNKLYTGDLVQNRRNKLNYKIKKIVYNPENEWIVVPNTHEPLVDKKTFEKIGQMLPNMQIRTEKKEIRLLDGLLYCYECKHRIGICKPRKSDNRTYIVCNYYRMNSKRKECSSHSFNYDYLEENIINIIKNISEKYLNLEKISDSITSKYKIESYKDKLINHIDKLQDEIEKDKDYLDKMYLDKLDNKIDDEMFERISDKINNNISFNRKKLSKLKEIFKKENSKSFSNKECVQIIKDFLETKELTREMVLKLIKKIEIRNNKVVDIYFNFQEPFLLTNS